MRIVMRLICSQPPVFNMILILACMKKGGVRD